MSGSLCAVSATKENKLRNEFWLIWTYHNIYIQIQICLSKKGLLLAIFKAHPELHRNSACGYFEMDQKVSVKECEGIQYLNWDLGKSRDWNVTGETKTNGLTQRFTSFFCVIACATYWSSWRTDGQVPNLNISTCTYQSHLSNSPRRKMETKVNFIVFTALQQCYISRLYEVRLGKKAS